MRPGFGARQRLPLQQLRRGGEVDAEWRKVGKAKLERVFLVQCSPLASTTRFRRPLPKRGSTSGPG